MAVAKPLHVRVAEALGWTECYEIPAAGDHPGGWYGKWPPGPHGGTARTFTVVPLFDTDWRDGGPLFEKYASRMEVTPPRTEPARYSQEDGHLVCDAISFAQWVEVSGPDDHETIRPEDGYGATILEATCELVLRLRANNMDI